MRRLFGLTLILLFVKSSIAFSQCPLFTREELRNQKTYTDLEQALQEKKSVYRLDLSYTELDSFPMAILKLKCLQELDLSHNDLSELPENLCQLKKLQYLHLQSNQLGRLPVSIGKCKNLKVIDLRENPLVEGELERIQMLLPATEILFKGGDRSSSPNGIEEEESEE